MYAGREGTMRVVFCVVLVFALGMSSADALGQDDSVAVVVALPAQLEVAEVPDAMIIGLVAELGDRYARVWGPDETVQRLQLEPLDPDAAWSTSMLTELDEAAAIYFDGYDPSRHTMRDALEMLSPWEAAIDKALQDPLRFSVNVDVASQVKVNMGEVARAMIAAGAHEEGGEMVDLLIAVAPVGDILDSKRLVPPLVQEAIASRLDTLRSRATNERVSLIVKASGEATGCGFRLNGDYRAVLPVEDVINVEPGRVYGLSMTCGAGDDALTLGPYRLSITAQAQTLPVGCRSLDSSAALRRDGTLRMPSERSAQRDVAMMLRTLMAVDTVFVIVPQPNGSVLT